MATNDDVGQRKPTILVLEQDPLLRWSLTTYLSRFFTVLTIGSLNEFGRAARAEFIDVVVSSEDLAQDAETLCRWIRRRNPAVAAVQMVAATLDADVCGDLLRIEKPFQLQALVDLLWVALKTHQGAKRTR